MRILVLGYLIRGPMGGMAWHHVQYVLGLLKLGHEVCFIEDSGDSPYCCYDPERGITDDNPAYGLKFATQFFEYLNLTGIWAYYDHHRQCWEGPLAGNIQDRIAQADILLNLSCSNPIRPWLEGVPVRVLIDTDPVFTQIRNLKDEHRQALTKQHTAFFTFGENLGKTGCSIPNDGISWQPTRQPIVVDAWPAVSGPSHGPLTTIMQWESYPDQEYGGTRYGLKASSFEAILDLPQRTTQILEIALGSPDAPRQQLKSAGWLLKNPLEIAKDPQAYQRYIQSSRGEFSVAKQAYVMTRSGWFSERSAGYLASGRPVIVQDTAFSDWMECGRGVFAFQNMEEAQQGIESLNRNYEKHCQYARAIAIEYFDSATILSKMLEDALGN